MTSQQTPPTAKVTTPGEREIRVERVYDAPRDRVFETITDRRLIPELLGEPNTTTIVDRMDVTPGGEWRFVMRTADGSEVALGGTYREVSPPERIVTSFEWEAMPGHVYVETTTLEDLGDRTKVTTATLFHTPEDRDRALTMGMERLERGMNETGARLDALLARILGRTRTMIPDTAVGRHVREWLSCVESGELDRLRDFAAANFSDAALLKRGAEDRAAWERWVLHRDTHGLVPAKVEHSSQTELALLVRARLTGEWLRVHMTVAGAPPQKIERLGVFFLPPPEVPEPHSVPAASEIADELGDFVDLLAGAGCFAGAVLLAEGDDVLLERAWGLANQGSAVANRPATRFNVDAIGEMFTAVAVAQLVERGLVDFGDDVGRHLREVPRALADVTIHQLLTHTSGLGDLHNERYWARRETLVTLADYLALFADEPLVFAPGARYGYSRAGYVVLGAVVEQVSGQDFLQYVREHVHLPARMTDTDCCDYDHPDVATGYMRARDGRHDPSAPLQPNLALLPPRGGPAGGGFSTVGDLHRFAQALLAHRLLSSELTEQLLAGKVQWGPFASYGYGFEERRFGGSIGHRGGAPGVSSDIAIYPALGYTVVVLANCDPPVGARIADRARRLIAPGGQRDLAERGAGHWRNGWLRRPRAIDGPAVRAAAAVMTRHLGAPVALELASGCLEAHKPVVRCRVTDGPATAPRTVVVKHLPQPSSTPSQALFCEWAGNAFLSSLHLDPPVSPAFYGADRLNAIVVVEDLGGGDSLAEVLLGSDSASAQTALMSLARSLGRMHAATIGRAAEYQRLRAGLGPPDSRAILDLSTLTTRFAHGLAAVGLSLGDAADDVQHAAGQIAAPGPFLAYLHGDPCPNNNRLIDGRTVLIDFAAGRLGHALLDGVYGRIPFPTCWHARRLPPHLPQLMEDSYRSELVRGCPAAQDDATFTDATAAACACWLIDTTAHDLPRAARRDDGWGISTVGQRLAHRTALFAQLADETGSYRALAALLGRLVDTLGAADQDMALYPAFGGPPVSIG